MKNELYPDETSDAAKNWSNISSFTGDLALNQVLFFYLNTKKIYFTNWRLYELKKFMLTFLLEYAIIIA